LLFADVMMDMIGTFSLLKTQSGANSRFAVRAAEIIRAMSFFWVETD
jgi:hypothetical protein